MESANPSEMFSSLSPSHVTVNDVTDSPTKQLISEFNTLHIQSSPSNSPSRNSDTVKTDDCIAPAAAAAAVAPSSALPDRAPPNLNKYALNQNFNQRSPDSKLSHPVTLETAVDDWLPDILKDQHWPDSDLADNTNPYLSLGAGSDTMIQSKFSNAKEQAEWRKYQDQRFEGRLKLQEVKLEPLNETNSFAPDTFANKPRKQSHQHDSFTPSSPLKLFGTKQDTYTTERFTDMLNRLDVRDGTVVRTEDEEEKQLKELVKGSDELYKGLVGKNKGFLGGQMDKSQDQSDSLTYSEDLTSEVGDLNTSAPSSATTNALLSAGNYLFDNLKNKLGDPILRDTAEDGSDYTSDDENGNPSFSTSSPTPSSVHPDVTASLDVLKEKLNLDESNVSGINKAVSTPKIKSDTIAMPQRHKGLNFIPGDDYKGKIYDKKLHKYIPRTEYRSHEETSNFAVTDETVDALANISDINDPQEEENAPKNRGVSFKLPGQPAESSGVDLSFSQTNKSLVSAITENYPTQDWNEIEKLDLADKELDKLRDLQKFTPNVRSVDASNNRISHVDGVPSKLQVLKLGYNQISTLAMFDMANLHTLDLRNNALDRLSGLTRLYNLTTLNVSSNRLKSLEGLSHLKMLRLLNLSDNRLRGELDFKEFDWEFLEVLKLDRNDLTSIRSLESLPGLSQLSVNHNKLTSLRCDYVHSAIKKISINSNKLTQLDLQMFPGLRVLKASRNFLEGVENMNKEIMKVSIKCQSNSKVTEDLILRSFSAPNFRILNLTGGVPPPLLFKRTGHFSNIVSLNLSAMNLEELPKNLGRIFPLLCDLNLNFNRIKTVEGLSELRYLKKLKLLSNSISDLQTISQNSQNFRTSLKLLDLRVNPINKNLYPYVFWDTVGVDSSHIFEQEQDGGELQDETTLNLKDYEDIEAFSIEYSKLYEKQGLENWSEKNSMFLKSIKGAQNLYEAKLEYETNLIVWFENINYLDGLRVDYDRRVQERRRFLKRLGRK